ncbi:phage tail tape measure protein [Klebsiella pneumoniae]|uniref:phage tail tape measure protein n=1 Tax=Klebsiella pneumoniae TaxID=573 RepID=UPI001E42FC6E|nr:phage tail tape measure protein [Klebsiella pneumoniae]EIX9615025.1 phage tail tape measure protein [Klebsiella pneumoniae]EJC6299062.1 phage tail tape measure protein [Klebsiella pneumoniae]EKV8469347.1 phage tail tape measure protein [Klebsiella pneumoniae]EKV9776410.1 phage tail tape measure protein [Klebsiella pneumoniae]EKX6830759.1 phage tail tape measure protein [Klebsiella pneumoniae]
MSNDVKLQVLLKAVDQATRPFKSIQTASKTLSGDIRDTQKSLRELNGQASRIDGFRKASAQLAVTGQELKKAKQEAAALAIQFKNTEQPTRAQAQAMDAARKSAAALQLKHNSLRQAVQRQRQELSQAGINTRTLAADERRLKTSISETTAQLNRQREALARVSAQQAKLNAVKQRYQSGKELAAGSRNAGVAATGLAMSGLYAESRFIAPGIGFDKQMSGTQAILGLDKGDAKLAAIRQQARDIGATTAFSPGDVARTQTTLARSGYKADDVLAATGSTVNLSLAAGVDIAEAADIITNMQSAFNLPTTEIQRVADVMTKGFTSSNTGLVELGEAMKYVAPIAEAAGASIESTTSMLGVLADNGIKGSMAGTGASAIFNRLQAPMGKAVDAIAELGVKTRDSKGNMLPVEGILKDIYTSFAKNNLGTAEQGEYLKVIFGEEAMKGAIKLVAAAGNGSLDKKRREIQGSGGTTELIAKIQTSNLDGDLKNLQSAWEDLQIEVFEKQDSALRKLTQSATEWLGTVAAWTKANPELTKTLFNVVTGALTIIGVLGGIGLVAWPVITGINAIIAAAGVMGTVFTVAGSAIATALGAITWPIVAVGAAIVAGALLIRKYWEPISAFFSGVIEGIISAFAPVGEMFAPLAPIFDGLGEKLRKVWQWFKDLIAPVKATQETLDSCKNVGIVFGQALADALMLPLNIFNKLRGGLDVILEKLGLVKKESSNIDAETSKAPSVGQGGSYIPATSSLGGYQAYQPVTAPVGRTYIDQSSPTYQINMPGGAPGGQLGNQFQDALEKYDRDKRAKARASMMHD